MVPRDGEAANPFHSLAALQNLAHHASFRTATASAVAFPHDWIFCSLFKSHPVGSLFFWFLFVRVELRLQLAEFGA
jgi:hypothetical protein